MFRVMETASQIIETIGRDRVMAAVGVQDGAVRKAIKDGVMPASWFDKMEQLAGQSLPRNVFSFKGQGV